MTTDNHASKILSAVLTGDADRLSDLFPNDDVKRLFKHLQMTGFYGVSAPKSTERPQEETLTSHGELHPRYPRGYV